MIKPRPMIGSRDKWPIGKRWHQGDPTDERTIGDPEPF
jgi:hypothetical protein